MKRWVLLCNDVVMGVLAVAAIVLAFQPNVPRVFAASIAIWIVFLVEYGVRLALARDRRRFVRENVVDLVAILPYDLIALVDPARLSGAHLDILRGTRLVRLLRLLRFLRMVRGFSVLWRMNATFRGVLGTNHLGHALLVTAFLVVSGGVSACVVDPREYPTLGQGLWWSLMTTANVGYDAIAPKDGWARLIGAALMLVGIGTVGMITGSIATYFLGHRRATNPHVRHLQEQLDRWDEMTERERRGLAGALRSLAVQADRSPAPRAEASDGASPSVLGAPLPD